MNKFIPHERSIPREYYGGGGLPSVRICLAEEVFATHDRRSGDVAVGFDYPSDYFNHSQCPARNFQGTTVIKIYRRTKKQAPSLSLFLSCVHLSPCSPIFPIFTSHVSNTRSSLRSAFRKETHHRTGRLSAQSRSRRDEQFPSSRNVVKVVRERCSARFRARNACPSDISTSPRMIDKL